MSKQASPLKTVLTKKRRNSPYKTSTATIRPSKTFYPSAEEMEDIVNYVDKLWQPNKNSSGIIKIVPEKNWQISHEKEFKKFEKDKILSSEAEIEVREQSINNLEEGNTFNYKKVTSLGAYFKETLEYEANLNVDASLSLEEKERIYWEKWSDKASKLLKRRD